MSGSTLSRGKGGNELGEVDDMSIGSASTVDVTDGISDISGPYLSVDRKSVRMGVPTDRYSAKRIPLGPLGEDGDDTYVTMGKQSGTFECGGSSVLQINAVHAEGGPGMGMSDSVALSDDAIVEIGLLHNHHTEDTGNTRYVSMPCAPAISTSTFLSGVLDDKADVQEQVHF